MTWVLIMVFVHKTASPPVIPVREAGFEDYLSCQTAGTVLCSGRYMGGDISCGCKMEKPTAPSPEKPKKEGK